MLKIPTGVVRHIFPLPVCLIVLFHPIISEAASHTWSGGGAGGFWSMTANWVGNSPPAFGEAAPVTVTFPSGAARINNTNDLGRLTLDQLNFLGTGYTINGVNAGTNLTLQGSAGTAVLNTASAINTIGGSVNLILANNVNFTINTNGSLILGSVVKGSGGLTKLGLGALTLYANFADTYAGKTYVKTGTLMLYCGTSISPQISVPGYLEIGGGTSLATVQLLANSQLSPAATLQMNSYGLLDLNNFSTTCGPLMFNGGGIETGNGTLTLGGDVSAISSDTAYIDGKLSLGGVTRQFNLGGIISYLELSASISSGGNAAGLALNGGGFLIVDGSNTFSGPITINDGNFYAYDQTAFGTGAGGVTVNSNGILSLITDYMIVSNISLTLDGHGSTTGGRLASVAADGYWYGPVQFASDSTFENVFSSQSWMVINGPISGPGGVKLIGGDAMYFAGDTDNTYTGTTYISSAQTNSLGLSKNSGATAISGPVVVGNPNGAANSAFLVLNAPNQIANTAPITINQSGVFDLLNYNESVGGLTFHDGNVQGTGQLTLLGNVTNYGGLYGYADITCPLSLGGQTRSFNAQGGDIYLDGPVTDGGAAAGITKYGSQYLFLQGSNSYSGLTLVNDGTLGISGTHALGATVAGTTLAGGNGMFMVDASVTGELLTVNSPVLIALQRTNAWNGPITLAADLDCFGLTDEELLTFGGAISGPGGLKAEGSCNLRLTGTNANTFTGALKAQNNLVELDKTNACAVAGSLDISSLVTVRYRNANQIADTAAVTVNVSGTLDLNNFPDTIGDFSGAGTVTLGSGHFTVSGTNASNIFSGSINGNALCELDKTNGNTLTLSGVSTYTGNTFVQSGKLLVNGSQPAGAIYVLAGATLGGSGTIGDLYAAGIVSPGSNGPGKLNAASIFFNAGSALVIELNGTNAGTGYDQLNATGTVNLNSATQLQVTKNFISAVSNQFTIVANDASDSIGGNFSGLFDGSALSVGADQFLIRYYGNVPANDIVLTQTGAGGASSLTNATRLVSGFLQLSGVGVPNFAYTVGASTNLAATNWISIGTTTANAGGIWQFTDTNAPGFARRFYRLSYP